MTYRVYMANMDRARKMVKLPRSPAFQAYLVHSFKKLLDPGKVPGQASIKHVLAGLLAPTMSSLLRSYSWAAGPGWPEICLILHAISPGKKSTLHLSTFAKVCFSPWTLKPGIPPPWTLETVRFSSWRVIRDFQKRFCLFFYLFRLNLWKIIVNHKKS